MMRKLLMTAALAVPLIVTACATNDTSDARTYYNTLTTYNSLMDSLIAARQAGKIDDKQYMQIERARSCSDDALTAMKPRATDEIEGNLPQAALSSVQECLNDLIIELSKTQES